MSSMLILYYETLLGIGKRIVNNTFHPYRFIFRVFSFTNKGKMLNLAKNKLQHTFNFTTYDYAAQNVIMRYEFYTNTDTAFTLHP